MGYTTFTGPVRAGNILNTTGTLPGVNVGNVGQVVMAQSAVVDEGVTPAGSTIAGLTPISIPSYSQILSISFACTTAFSVPVSVGNTTNGVTTDAVYFANATAITPGITSIATWTATQLNNWISSGYPDSQVVIAGGVLGGGGRAVVTVTYLQGPNGNT